jgi:flagellar biosynthesis protein FlhF
MMQVKRYMAPTFAEALIQAKNELGTDAVIVESKKLRVGGIFGLFGREMTELTVAVDTRATQRPVPVARPAQPASRPVTEPAAQAAPVQPPVHTPVQAAIPGQVPAPAPIPAPGVPDPTGALARAQRQLSTALQAESLPPGALVNLEQEMASLRVAVSRLLEKSGAVAAGLHGFGRQVFDTLTARGVEEATALEIGQRLTRADEPEGRVILQQELTRLMGSTAPIEVKKGQRKIIALVGPTGVGKTTTLAKLAAHFTLDRGLDVGVITSDTYRIAAIDQLRTYADILGVPLYAVDRPEEAATALMETRSKELVLVDTGGRNFRDPARMEELRELLAVLRPDETHLVIPLNINPRDAFDALDAFLPLGVNRLTFTKLDETTSPGLILNLKMRCDAPVGYLTHGQSVPDDIIPADQADFTKILMGA